MKLSEPSLSPSGYMFVALCRHQIFSPLDSTSFASSHIDPARLIHRDPSFPPSEKSYDVVFDFDIDFALTLTPQRDGCLSIGIGRGDGSSYEMSDRRPGDVAELYADPKKSGELLGWSAELGTKEMCEDTWRWQSTNPMGYKEDVEIVNDN